MAYFSPAYARHFHQDLPGEPLSPYDPDAFILPKRSYIIRRENVSSTWNALASPGSVTTAGRRDQAYRSFQYDCYTASAAGSMPNSPTSPPGWWPPRLRRGRGSGNRAALFLGWLCLAFLAMIVFTACWIIGRQDSAVSWALAQCADAGQLALEASRTAIRKARCASKLGLRRVCEMSAATAARTLSLCLGTGRWVCGLTRDGFVWVRISITRACHARPTFEPSLQWLATSCAAIWLLFELHQQWKPKHEDGPVYVLVSRFQSHGSGPWQSA